MGIARPSQPVVLRGGHTAAESRALSAVSDMARSELDEAFFRLASTGCSEGDTLVPGGDSDTLLPDLDLIGQLRRAVPAAEALGHGYATSVWVTRRGTSDADR